jgi:hypothetical protein
MRDYLICIKGDDCVLSLGSRHRVGRVNPNTQTSEKVCVWCAFDISHRMDQTLCIQLTAGHSVWNHLVTQEPYKKQNLGAGFKISEEYRIERAK